MASAFQGLGETRRRRAEEDRQKRIADETYKAAMAYSQNPDALQKPAKDVAQELGIEPEAALKGRVLMASHFRDMEDFEAERLRNQKAKTGALYQQARQAFVTAEQAREAGDPRAYAVAGVEALNAYPDGYKWEVVEGGLSEAERTAMGPAAGRVLGGGGDGQAGRLMVKVTSPLGKTKTVGVDEVDRRLDAVRQNPSAYAPEQFFQQSIATNRTRRDQNAEWALNPRVMTDKKGNKVYATKQIDPATNEPRVVYSDKPLYEEDEKILDVTDLDGYRTPETWKRMEEARQARAELGKTLAETRSKEMETAIDQFELMLDRFAGESPLDNLGKPTEVPREQKLKRAYEVYNKYRQTPPQSQDEVDLAEAARQVVQVHQRLGSDPARGGGGKRSKGGAGKGRGMNVQNFDINRLNSQEREDLKAIFTRLREEEGVPFEEATRRSIREFLRTRKPGQRGAAAKREGQSTVAGKGTMDPRFWDR
jgi:hypothetical protein